MKQDQKTKPKKSRSLAVTCGILVVVGAGAAGLYWKDKWVGPPPPPQALPAIPAADFQKVREQVRLMGRTLLGVTAEQEKQIDAIWQRPPATLDELVDFTKRSDAILTEKQRTVVRPIRKMMRNQVIDRLLEPGRGRFIPEDFERLKNAVKLRVEKRVEG